MNNRASINFDEILLTNNGNEFIAEYNGRYFILNDFMYNILTVVKEERSAGNSLVHERVNLTHEELSFVLTTIGDKLNATENNNLGNIYLKATVFNKKQVNWITGYVKYLLPKHSWIFFVILILLFATFVYISKPYLIAKTSIALVTSGEEILLLYISVVLASIFHEFGHASATKRFNLEPGEIGFGFFFIFPVFFSNVSSVWKLNKIKRIIVNLSGIYYQLIFAIIVYVFNDNNIFLNSFIKANFAIIAFSLLPFFKNDGYWVISDYFGIKNLYAQSYTYLFRLMKKQQPFKLFIFLYSIVHLGIVCYLLFNFTRFFGNNIIKLYAGIPAYNFEYILIILKFLFNFIILYSIVLRFLMFFKSPQIHE